MTRRRIILLVAGGVVLLAVAFAGWQGARAWWAWRGIERIEFDTAAARSELPFIPLQADSGSPELAATPTPTFSVVEYDTVLAIGSDERTEEEQELAAEAGRPIQERAYADAILLWLSPTDGGDPALVSLPRDLLVVDPCTGTETKLDRTLAGCGETVSGPELVALAVEDYTGIAIDHYATFDFEAFIDVIDSLGGVEVCVEYALREGTLDLLPAGCSTADGKTALAWVRSRGTQEFVDGEWRFVEGVSDLSRTERQQQLMFAMLAKMKTMRSPTALAGIAESVGDSVVLGESLVDGRCGGDGLGSAERALVEHSADHRADGIGRDRRRVVRAAGSRAVPGVAGGVSGAGLGSDVIATCSAPSASGRLPGRASPTPWWRRRRPRRLLCPVPALSTRSSPFRCSGLVGQDSPFASGRLPGRASPLRGRGELQRLLLPLHRRRWGRCPSGARAGGAGSPNREDEVCRVVGPLRCGLPVRMLAPVHLHRGGEEGLRLSHRKVGETRPSG